MTNTATGSIGVDEATTVATSEDEKIELARNVQLNPGGDPAREKEYLEQAKQRTGPQARADRPQTAAAIGNESITQKIREADILDPTQPEPYVAEDAKPSQAQAETKTEEAKPSSAKARG